jgi:hypothetical protein
MAFRAGALNMGRSLLRNTMIGAISKHLSKKNKGKNGSEHTDPRKMPFGGKISQFPVSSKQHQPVSQQGHC